MTLPADGYNITHYLLYVKINPKSRGNQRRRAGEFVTVRCWSGRRLLGLENGDFVGQRVGFLAGPEGG